MRVSVVIPCHNSLRFLPGTLDSVLDQDLPTELVQHYEVVLVDDGGSDDLEGWAASLDDPRVRVVRQENAGVSAARNRGVDEATGDLIGFCDSDDLWTPTTAKRLVSCFADHRVGLSYGWYDVIDSDGRPTGRVSRSAMEGEVWEQLLMHNPIAASGVMVRRAVFDDVGGFAVNRDKFRIDVEDWELWIRIARRWHIGMVPEVVAHHRRHGSNSSIDVESIDAAYRHFLEVVFADASPAQRSLLPLATARIEIRLASQWLNDRQEPQRALDHLERASSLAPALRREREFLRLKFSALALRATGPRGYSALRSANRAARVTRERIRAARGGERGGVRAGA